MNSTSDIKICSRCVMDNESDTTITFLSDGTCNYCNDTLIRKDNEYFPNEKGKQKLDQVMAEIKKGGIGKQYDCMVGVSGGVDSSYIIYLGHQYGLRMLAIHIDDGFDTDIAQNNIKNLCEKAKVDLVTIKPDKLQFADLTKAFLHASVPNLALPQDNLLLAALNDAAEKYNIRYSLSGANFALESILERSTNVNAADKKHIIEIHKQFGEDKINKLRLFSLYERYIKNKYFNKVEKIYPLNYIDYNLNKALEELKFFCDYNYYGGKHYESILTRFLQCYYLPVKYKIDKRKSHYSSMIISGQMTREEALERMKSPLYTSEELRESDFNFISDYLGLSREAFEKAIALPPKQHSDYPISGLNKFASLARKLRKFLGA